jgi:hypothetical protein
MEAIWLDDEDNPVNITLISYRAGDDTWLVSDLCGTIRVVDAEDVVPR